MKTNYPYLCGVDWLSIYCHTDPLSNCDYGEFRLVVDEFRTPQYKNRARVFFRNDLKIPFCEILFGPTLSVMDIRSCHLRILNKHLYECGWYLRLQKVLLTLRMQYRSITRIDLYYDCNKFKNGRLPKSLALDYISKKVLKIGINRGQISFKDYGYAIAQNTTKDAVQVNVGLPNINAITWGNKGYIQTQLYNKSLELREVKFKQHIVDAWERVGLNPSEVWRTEIRIQKQGLSLQLLDTGDMWALGPDDVANNERIYEVFLAYAAKHMRFVVADYHRKRQQMLPIDLFSYSSDIQQVVKPRIARNSAATFREARRVHTFLRGLADLVHNSDIIVRDRLAADKLYGAAGVIYKIMPPEWLDTLPRERVSPRVELTATIRRLHQYNLRKQLVQEVWNDPSPNRQTNWLLSPEMLHPQAAKRRGVR